MALTARDLVTLFSMVVDLNIEHALAQARDFGVRSLEAQALLAHVLNKSRGWLLAYHEIELNGEQATAYTRLLDRCRAGEPLAYLTGQREFYGLSFQVSPAVLVPRPETEHLVEAALEWSRPRQPLTIADVGTGSGAIAISLAVHLPEMNLVATDTSREALEIAFRNAVLHQVVERIQFVQTDLLSGVADEFDVIVSNPPYIPALQLKELTVARYEPHVALDGGKDGLAVIRSLLSQSSDRLARPGLLLVEIGADQGERATAMARAVWPDAAVSLLPDYAGHDRVVRVERPAP